MATSFTPRRTASSTIRRPIAWAFFASPTKAPKLTASKQLRVQFSPAAFSTAAAGTMECLPARAT